jgi:hypothetical protein
MNEPSASEKPVRNQGLRAAAAAGAVVVVKVDLIAGVKLIDL